MKKFAIAAAALFISAGAFAQKDELKALKKIDKKDQPSAQDMQEFEKILKDLEPKIANAEDEQKADYYYYKGELGAYKVMTNPMTAQAHLQQAIADLNKVLEIEKGMKKKEHTKEIEEEIFPQIKTALVAQATALGKQENYKAAIPLFEQVYRVSPKDTLYLYNAAAYAVNSQQYDKAIDLYNELLNVGFDGGSLNFTAKNVQTGETEYYGNKQVRDQLVTLKTHTDPGIYREPSKKGDIIKNLALLYINKGETEKAKAAIAAAKKANPKDTTLLLAEAQIYLESKDYENYKKTVQEVLNLGSKDPNLYFNLGVTSAQSGDIEGAKTYYTKTIELKPDFTGAYQNLAILELNGEEDIVKEMNSLGTSKKDMARYDQLKDKRNAMYKKALVHLEKAHQVDRENQDIKSLLGTMYQALEMTKEYKALQAE